MRTDADDALAGAKKNTLPDKPSELIRVAITDLIKCEEDPRYKIEMHTWHEPAGGVCEVCLAGSTMVQRLDAPYGEFREPADYGPSVSRKLRALDFLRQGHISVALDQLNIEHSDLPARFSVVQHAESPEEFKYDMRSLAQLLEDHGL